jgi:SnoaL-like domain
MAWGSRLIAEKTDLTRNQRMEISLPQPIEAFVRAENSGDLNAMSDCFAPYATVREDDQYLEGIAAIMAWRARMKQKHGHTLTPISFNSSDGHATLKAELSGRFPGSPMRTNFHFTLVNDQIASLQIRA